MRWKLFLGGVYLTWNKLLMSFVLPSEQTDSHRELTFQRSVAKALGVGCKTSFCQSVRKNIYTRPVQFQQGCSDLTIGWIHKLPVFAGGTGLFDSSGRFPNSIRGHRANRHWAVETVSASLQAFTTSAISQDFHNLGNKNKTHPFPHWWTEEHCPFVFLLLYIPV